MPLLNQQIAGILLEIGKYLEMQGEAFKPRAYEKAAEATASLGEDIRMRYEKGGRRALEGIPGVGASIAEKIEEFIKTGRVAYYERLKRKTPVKLEELSRIEGLGPKSIKKLYDALGIKDLKTLEVAARAGKIGKTPGFGEKTEENILKGIEFLKKSSGKFSLGFALPEARIIEARLRGLRNVKRAIVAGSVRRRKETVRDIDVLVVSDHPALVMDYFVTMPEVVRVYAKGETKSSIKVASGLDVDLRVVLPESYGAALNYFTGSKDHNVALRQLAADKGYKLNEYGIFSARGAKSKMIAGGTEEEIYRTLGLQYIEPEMREMQGEVERARTKKLPTLIGYSDLRGDLQVQTDWTDGADSIEGMAKAAAAAGLEYIAITDHTKRLAMTGGLGPKDIARQWSEIDRVEKKLRTHGARISILKGTECDILKDGSLDLPDEVLAKLDVVGVSVHSYFNLERKDQTERIIRAMRNPHVHVLFHPTGRLIGKRDPYEVDMDAIIAAAKETGTILEINAFPERLDLKDEHIRKAITEGVHFSIDSDAHSSAHFGVLEYGIAQARRGWAEKKDVVNAWPREAMFGFLKKRYNHKKKR